MIYKPSKEQLNQARERLKNRKNRGTDDEYVENLLNEFKQKPSQLMKQVKESKIGIMLEDTLRLGAEIERQRIRAAVEQLTNQTKQLKEQVGEDQDDFNAFFAGKLFAFMSVLHILNPKRVQ